MHATNTYANKGIRAPKFQKGSTISSLLSRFEKEPLPKEQVIDSVIQEKRSFGSTSNKAKRKSLTLCQFNDSINIEGMEGLESNISDTNPNTFVPASRDVGMGVEERKRAFLSPHRSSEEVRTEDARSVVKPSSVRDLIQNIECGNDSPNPRMKSRSRRSKRMNRVPSSSSLSIENKEVSPKKETNNISETSSRIENEESLNNNSKSNSQENLKLEENQQNNDDVKSNENESSKSIVENNEELKENKESIEKQEISVENKESIQENQEQDVKSTENELVESKPEEVKENEELNNKIENNNLQEDKEEEIKQENIGEEEKISEKSLTQSDEAIHSIPETQPIVSDDLGSSADVTSNDKNIVADIDLFEGIPAGEETSKDAAIEDEYVTLDKYMEMIESDNALPPIMELMNQGIDDEDVISLFDALEV